jgi:hypothetical protein
MTVVSLAAWRRRRAEQQAIRAGHPSVVGGAYAQYMRIVAHDLVPEGYYAGLWQVGAGRVGHALRPAYDEWGDEVTRCGIEVLAVTRRRADRALRPCRRCFPS